MIVPLHDSKMINPRYIEKVNRYGGGASSLEMQTTGEIFLNIPYDHLRDILMELTAPGSDRFQELMSELQDGATIKQLAEEYHDE